LGKRRNFVSRCIGSHPCLWWGRTVNSQNALGPWHRSKGRTQRYSPQPWLKSLFFSSNHASGWAGLSSSQERRGRSIDPGRDNRGIVHSYGRKRYFFSSKAGSSIRTKTCRRPLSSDLPNLRQAVCVRVLVGGGEKGYQFGGRDGARCGVTFWPAVGAGMEEERLLSSLSSDCPRF